MKNFPQDASAGAKRVALAGLICVTALIFCFAAMGGVKKEAVRDNNRVLAAPAACTYDANNPKGATGKACSGLNQYCVKSGTSAICKEGCIGYKDNQWFFVDPAVESRTCYKPGGGLTVSEAAADAANQPDAVFSCGAAKRNDGGAYINYTVETNGSVTSATPLTLNQGQLCNYGECIEGSNTCGVSKTKCKNTAESIKTVFNTYFNYKKSNAIQDAIADAIEDAANDDDDETTSATAKAKTIKKYKNALLSKLMGCSTDTNDEIQCGSSTTMSKSEAETLLKKFEKMIYGSLDCKSTEKGLLYGLSNDCKVPFLTQQIDSTDKISCQYVEGSEANSWCPYKESEQFWGYSYACEQSIGGCYMYSWVSGAPEVCKTDADNKTVPAFDLWAGAGFPIGSEVDDGLGHAVGFDQDDNGDGGKVTGGALGGCGYKSSVMATEYPMLDASGNSMQYSACTAGALKCTADFTKDPRKYKEVNKIFTGKCLSPEDVVVDGTSDVDEGDEDKLGCSARGADDEEDSEAGDTEAETEFANGDYDFDDACTPWICMEGTWTRDNDCTKGSDEAKKECEERQEECEGEALSKGCAKDSQCPDGQYCVFDDLDAYNNADAGSEDGKTGTCGSKGCQSNNNDKAVFAAGAVVCGSDDNSQKCVDPDAVSSWKFWELNGEECDEKGCDKETGECVSTGGDVEDGECTKLDVIDQDAQETVKKCGDRECAGICLPFTVNETGDCESLVCKVTNDYDNATATGYEYNSKWYACLSPKSSSSNSKDTSRGNNPSKIHYEITCTDTDSKVTDTATGSCGFPEGDDNPYTEEEEEAEKEDEKGAEEGEKCTKDSDCEEGLVCEDGKCMSEEEAEKADEGGSCAKDSDCRDGLICEEGKCIKEEDAGKNIEAPTVTVTSPTGNVTSKTAQLSVTTNLNANCKYMDVTNGGSFTASNFAGGGMTMASSGYTHIATLNSLADSTGNSSDCKKTHNIVVLCQNSEARNQSNTESIGSGQTSFTVDLSGNLEYAPTVANAMDKTSFTVANPVLKVSTDRPASCQYAKDSTFSYGSGTDFTTTGNYLHNTELSDLASGDHTYYVVCKDADTCAANAGVKINFKVTLEGGDSTMNIVSTTAATQTVTNPTLSVTTDIPATCQYKNSSFTYGSGTQFANDDDYSHTSSLSSLSDGDYEFYVACKEKETGAVKSLASSIQTKLDREAADGEPEVSNTTEPKQSTDSPTISITTGAAAKCQYSTNSGFTYGEGTQFTTDGGTGHSVELSGISDGEHTYYIVCKDVATGKVNSTPVEIVFEVSNTANTCSDLDSNDRQSDDERDYDDGDDSDSKYVWRSVEDGTRDEFTKVDWYAGYQFTPDENGYVTQLCGYFADGQANEVKLYNGSYKELAKATVDGSDEWECVTISPVEVKTDKRYYVIARVEDGPIYYEYESGLLPMDAENVVIESGIRQLAEEDFGEDIFKYDYMVFGLVDVKIIFSGESEEGPEIEVNGPDGSVDDDSAVLSIETDEEAECRFDRDDVEYSDMKYDFGKTGEKVHEQLICNLDDGSFTFYVRCKNEDGDENDGSTLLQFEVSD